MDYVEYLQSPEWKIKRQVALERDGHRCKLCVGTMDLQVHHASYKRIGTPQEVNDLVTLCGTCHAKFHGKVNPLTPPELIIEDEEPMTDDPRESRLIRRSVAIQKRMHRAKDEGDSATEKALAGQYGQLRTDIDALRRGWLCPKSRTA